MKIPPNVVTDSAMISGMTGIIAENAIINVPPMKIAVMVFV
jgi:hypothetical protein